MHRPQPSGKRGAAVDAYCLAVDAPGLFAVVDRIGPGDNLEEHWFKTPYEVRA